MVKGYSQGITVYKRISKLRLQGSLGLKVFVTLAGDRDLILRAHMVTHNPLELQFQRTQCLPPALVGTAFMQCTDIHAGQRFIHIK